MLIVAILFAAALLIALGIAWLLRNEIGVKHVADDYAAGGSDHWRGRAADLSFDRERLGA